MSESRLLTFQSGHSYFVPAELVEYFVREGGEPERALIELARKFLRPDGVFVDVGAHIGTYARNYAAEVAETHAFEPQRDTYNRLVAGIVHSGNDTILAHHCALGSVKSERMLRVVTSDGGLSSLRDLPNTQSMVRKERVSVRTLDSFELENICLMKLDVEGFELEVLRGSQETLRRSKYPPLLVEVWTEEWYASERQAIAGFLEELGYKHEPAPGFPYMWICEHPDHPRADVTIPVLAGDSVRRTRIVLTMIVKNETRVLARGLATMLPHVDGFVICDTGSTDGTPALIARLGGEYCVRGTVHRREWKNYGHNRTESAKLAREWIQERGWALDETYLLFLDADMKLEVAASFNRESLVGDAYNVLQGTPGSRYPNLRLARADYPWESLGVTHEVWVAAGAAPAVLLTELAIEDGNDGGNRGSKFERDRQLLEEGIHAEPENERYMFYLAQTYFDLGEFAKAAEWYEKRWLADGYYEEKQYAHMKWGRALLQQGDARGVDRLLRAFEAHPVRAEALFYLAVHYREQGENHAAALLLDRIEKLPRPDPSGLFVEEDIFEWRLAWERAIVSYYTGDHAAGRRAADQVARFRRPGIDYEQNARNILHYTEPLRTEVVGRFVVPDDLKKDPKSGTEYEASSPTLVRMSRESFLVGIRLVNYNHWDGVGFSSKDADGIIRTRELLGAWSPGKQKPTRGVELLGALEELSQNVPEEWPAAQVLGLEDQRFVHHDGSAWLTANSWQVPGRPARSPQMVLGRLHENGVEHLVPLSYGEMGLTEKNWLPFSDHGKLRLIYGYDPLIVLEPDLETGACTEIARHESPWQAHRFRGSAGPVQSPGGGGRWLILLHEVTSIETQRVYGQRLLELDKHYRPTRLSEPFYIEHRGVEFPLGFVALDETRAIITYGVEERESAYAIVLWSELVGRLLP